MNSKKKIFIQIITNSMLVIGIGLTFSITHFYFKEQNRRDGEENLLSNVMQYAYSFSTELFCNKEVINRFEKAVKGSTLVFSASNKEFQLGLRPLFAGGDYFITDSDGTIIETSAEHLTDDIVAKFIQEYYEITKISNGLKTMENNSGVKYLLAYSKPKLVSNIFILKIPSESLLFEYNVIYKRNLIIAILIYIFLSLLNFFLIKIII